FHICFAMYIALWFGPITISPIDVICLHVLFYHRRVTLNEVIRHSKFITTNKNTTNKLIGKNNGHGGFLLEFKNTTFGSGHSKHLDSPAAEQHWR
ncbi:hypothetical protein ACJX0J_038384, partial [Zea mays]